MDQSIRVIATVIGLVVVCTAAVAILGPLMTLPTIDAELVIVAAILAALIISADFFEIDAPLATVRVTVSVSSALCFAAAITLGPFVGAAVAGLSALTVELLQRRELIKTVFNTANYLLATFLGGAVYFWLSNPEFSPIGSLANFLATVIAASTYTFVNSGTIALVLSQVVGAAPLQVWRANLRSALFEHVTLPTLGVMIPVLKEESLFALVLVVIPLLGPYLAFRSYLKVHEETRSTLGVLADMLDRRDPYTAEHSKRVSEVVDKMIEHYPEVSFEDYEAIVTAARIHDLGKVTTSDATLMKAGKLDPQEREEIMRHSIDGSDILANISIFQEASVIIRHHHERWDGNGYPDGLQGEEIPIGSRLIAVADTYDAMTTDRPYRKALPHSVAISEIRRNAGCQFEPRAVDSFLKAMDEIPETASQSFLQNVTPSD